MLLEIKNIPASCKTSKIVLAGKIVQAKFDKNFPSSFEEFEKMKLENILPKQNKEIEENFWLMIKAAIDNGGVGIAATQIGLNKRFFVIRENEDCFRCFIHPSYKINDSTINKDFEGCLSVPKYFFKVPRYNSILASWFEFDDNGSLIYKEEQKIGIAARIFQHELDHFDTKCIIDRAENINRETKRNLLKTMR